MSSVCRTSAHSLSKKRARLRSSNRLLIRGLSSFQVLREDLILFKGIARLALGFGLTDGL